MALTGLIQYDDEIKEFFKSVIPSKKEFKTFSSNGAFSAEYEMKVAYNLKRPYDSVIVGTSFDYLARWMVARVAQKGRENAYKNLVAELGLARCRIEANRCGIDLCEKYQENIEICQKYIEGRIAIFELVETAIFFAKLEQIYRRQIPPFQIELDDLFRDEKSIAEDLLALVEVFDKVFIKSGIVTNESIVIYNPSFGGASVISGGADADIFVDGTLYDFKCTKKRGYVWNEVAQILGYYMLDNIAKLNRDSDNELKDHEIKRIAFYRARYGEVEYVDLSRADYDESINKFAELLGREEYEDYLEQRFQKQIEKKKKQLEIKKKVEKALKCSVNDMVSTREKEKRVKLSKKGRKR